jgi:hypothetical protein
MTSGDSLKHLCSSVCEILKEDYDLSLKFISPDVNLSDENLLAMAQEPNSGVEKSNWRREDLERTELEKKFGAQIIGFEWVGLEPNTK